MIRARAPRWLPVALIVLVAVVIVLFGLTPPTFVGGPPISDPRTPLLPHCRSSAWSE